MSKKLKAIERLRQNPLNVRFDDLDKLLISLGFEKRNKSGSHFVYTIKTIKGTYRITVPFRKPFLLPVYVKNALQIIDDLLSDNID